MNRVTSCTDSNGKTVRYGYDGLGNLITLTYPGGEIVRYTYYRTGRIKTVTDSKGRITYYTYDGTGNVTSMERPDGTREENTYDALGQLTERKDTRLSDGAVIGEYHYTYDERGNILSMTGTGTGGITVTAQGEVNIDQSTDSSTDRNEDSSTGRSIEDSTEETTPSNTATGLSQAEKAYLSLTEARMEYDADNRLIRYNGEEVRYDADGNMVYGPVNGVMKTLCYDCRNRLREAGNVRYEYDAENVRTAVITKKQDSSEEESDRETRTEYVTDRESGLSQVLVYWFLIT